jgi:hypothetical protein
MPAGAVIYYTTDGSDPGVGADNGPLSGELYSGGIELDEDAVIAARVYPPSEYSKWFVASEVTIQELDPDLVREVYIAGRFSLPDGRYRNISKLGEDGSVDVTFDPGLGASYGSIIAALVPVSGGRIIAGGDFDAMGNVPRGGLVRMLSDGSVDTSFNAALSNAPAP